MPKSPHISFYRRQQFKYLLTDFFFSEVIWLCFLIFRWLVVDEKIFGVNTILIPAFNFYRPLIIYPIACACIHYLTGYYIRPFNKKSGQELLQTLVSAFIISIGAFFIIIIDDNPPSYDRYYISLAALFLLQFTISYIPRLVITQHTKHLFRIGTYTYNTAIVGSRREAEELSKQLTHKNIVALIDIDELDDILRLKRKYKFDEVILALTKEQSENDLYHIIEKIYPTGVEIAFPARVYDILVGAARINTLDTNPLVVITNPKLTDWQMCVKRAFDIVTAAVCLILLSPVFAIISLLIKLDSKGSVIYKQERTGHYGRPFNILKFRTMYENSEQNSPQLSQVNDPRITRIGHYLRKYRLDELPQFWNVLRGDMSIVGPRPERAYYIEKIVKQAPYYCLLYKIRPGLTSWGPIRVGYTDTLEKMIQRLNYDMVYMENMSLALDLKIILYTFKVILDGKGQ